MTDVDLSQLAVERGGTARRDVPMPRHVMTRYTLPATLIVGFLGLVAWASRDIMLPPRPVTVVTVFATQADVRQEGAPLFQAAGWIEPRPTPVRVAALAPGVVEQLLVVEDQSVQAGEAVAELVKDDARLAADRARADLKLRQAELDEAKAALTAANTRLEQPVHLQAALGEAEASLAKVNTLMQNLPFERRRAEAQLVFAQKDYDGKTSANGVVADVEIDKARSALESAQALVDELRDRTGTLQQERSALVRRRDALNQQLQLLADEIKAKDEAEARVKAAAARVEQAHVVVAEAKLQQDRMTVRAPIDGRVHQLIAHPGTRLSSGIGHTATHDSSTVVTLYRPDHLQVRVDVRFEDVPRVSLGQPVQIENPALDGPLVGKVLFVSSEADIQKNTLQVKVEMDSPPRVFKPEMLVDVTFLAQRGPERTSEPATEMRLYVPQRLVRLDGDEPYVWLADQSAGIARKATIETGAASSDGLIEINDGLTLTSRVIDGGADGLSEGARIRITGEPPSRSSLDSRPHGAGGSTSGRLPLGDKE